MDGVPDDILLSIFDVLVHDLGYSPTCLLAVNRQWNALVSATPPLWTRVIIDITFISTIPDLIYGRHNYGAPNSSIVHDDFDITYDDLDKESGPLRRYLARSVPYDSNLGLPLDIEIYWCHSWNLAEETSFMAQHPALTRKSCQITGCTVLALRQWLIGDLMGALAGWNGGQSEVEIVKPDERKDFKRWRSFKMDLARFSCPCHDWSDMDLSPIGLEGYMELPILNSFALHSVRAWNDKFHAPSLMALTLKRSLLVAIPSLVSLTTLTIDSDRTGGLGMIAWAECINVQDLCITGSTMSTISTTHAFPRLVKLRLGSPMTRNLMRNLERTHGPSNPLQLLELCEYKLNEITSLFTEFPDFHVETLRIGLAVVRNAPDFPITAEEYVWPAGELLDYMQDRNVEIQGADEIVEKALEMVRDMWDYDGVD